MLIIAAKALWLIASNLFTCCCCCCCCWPKVVVLENDWIFLSYKYLPRRRKKMTWQGSNFDIPWLMHPTRYTDPTLYPLPLPLYSCCCYNIFVFHSNFNHFCLPLSIQTNINLESDLKKLVLFGSFAAQCWSIAFNKLCNIKKKQY